MPQVRKRIGIRKASGAAAVTAGLFLITLVALPALAQQAGWYSRPQASRGQLLFNNYCAECHRPDLTGAQGPALKGGRFLHKWTGRPLGNLYSFEHATMPAMEPGSMPDAMLLAITAFILQQNGFASRPRDLSKADMGTKLNAP